MRRRDFLKGAAAVGAGACLGLPQVRCGHGPATRKKVVVLGIDGMDPQMTRSFMADGGLPNFSRAARLGTMTPLGTSTPPQSPVAWSTVIAGASTRVHGIYDFIHREPATMLPYLSTSKVVPPSSVVSLGSWEIPLAAGKVQNLRQGKPFWDFLGDHDVPATLFKMPANFPCESGRVRMASGMGTPDLRGGYGSYTLFTTAPERFKQDTSGGKVVKVSFEGQRARCLLEGPENSLRKDKAKVSIPVDVWRDRRNDVVRLTVGGHERLLKAKEWSGWLPVSFPMIDHLSSAGGIIKFYVKAVHPELHLYVSPINIDPSDPVLPVVSSPDYGEELVRNVGYFYTQGFPEDTKALSEGVLDDDEYLVLAYQILDERRRLLEYELSRFLRQEGGFFFFYFSSLDQDTHMFYRAMDPTHPAYNPALGARHGKTLQRLYQEVDRIFGKVLSMVDIRDPDTTLLVMSDHGFAPFRRQVNLNTWLQQAGLLALEEGQDVENPGFFEGVDWGRTTAYNLGINAIYLNQRGREPQGIVEAGEVPAAAARIRDQLLRLQDPRSGQQAVLDVAITPEAEKRINPHAPDLIVGWNLGYRTSWDSILGGRSADLFSDNTDAWSGDHCVAPSLVPATLICNRKVTRPSPDLRDVTATVLAEFGIPLPGQFTGKPLYQR